MVCDLGVSDVYDVITEPRHHQTAITQTLYTLAHLLYALTQYSLVKRNLRYNSKDQLKKSVLSETTELLGRFKCTEFDFFFSVLIIATKFIDSS